jgi:diguanylate cyclase (GGDEF)-like protein
MQAKISSEFNILFADQDVAFCISARRALQQKGYKVALAHDDKDVSQLLEGDEFDVIVLGAALPSINGLEALREIKEKNVDAFVILIGDATPRFKRVAENEGAFASLPTPTDEFEQLCDTVSHALAVRGPRVKMQTTPDETRWLELLRELIDSSRTKPLAATLQVFLQASAEALNAEHSVLLLAQEDNRLTLESALGFDSPTSAARDFVKNVGDTFAWRIATERQTLIEVPTAHDGEVINRFVGTPLIVHDELLGVVVDYGLPAEPIDPARVVWLEMFAAEGALAIYLARLDSENERLSRHDPLSGALKRKVFLDLADHEFRRSWRYHQPISMILVDVDGMKTINSRNSRQFGDRVVREVTNVCRNIVRSVDLLGRYENDTLAILLVMTDHIGAKSAAERLRAGIESIKLADGQGPVNITATLGVCSYPRDNCASIFDLLAVTLEAQRAAQRSGANQIVYA